LVKQTGGAETLMISTQKMADTPHYKFTCDLLKRSNDESCGKFGKVFKDTKSDIEYLVVAGHAEMDCQKVFTIFGIKEIVRRPAFETKFDEATFKIAVELKDAPQIIQNEIISFFKYECVKIDNLEIACEPGAEADIENTGSGKTFGMQPRGAPNLLNYSFP
jgi:hypothetical protein